MVNRDPQLIKDVINKVIGDLETGKKGEGERILEAWKSAAGEKVLKHAKAVALRDKRLVINVDGSAWMYELSLRKDKILRELKSKLGKDSIEELQFRIGEI